MWNVPVARAYVFDAVVVVVVFNQRGCGGDGDQVIQQEFQVIYCLARRNGIEMCHNKFDYFFSHR